MTFVEMVNDVLIRLREATVQSVAETPYSTLIGRFVNDAKRQIEDSFSWNVLGRTVTITTTAGQYSYPLTGVGQKFSVMDVLNTTSAIAMSNLSFVEMTRFQNLGTPAQGAPSYYAFEGATGSDANVLLYSRPDGVYTIPFFLTVPQAPLTADSTVVLVPDFLVVQNAYARALVERGEDAGLTSSEAYQLYRGMLADSIALEGTRYPESQEFIAV